MLNFKANSEAGIPERQPSMTIQSFVRSRRHAVLLFLLILLATSGTAWRPLVRSAPTDHEASKAVVSPPPARLAEVPYDLISQDSLFSTLQDLTSIQPYSGWRSAATRGEAEALDYVAQRLSRFTKLREWGIELERQSFNVFISTEFWETRLQLTVDGSEFEAPAEGLRGSRWSRKLALMMDSDGVLNDTERDPLVASGTILVIQDEKSLISLKTEQVAGKVIFLNYALVDTILEPDALDNSARLVKLIDQLHQPGAILQGVWFHDGVDQSIIQEDHFPLNLFCFQRNKLLFILDQQDRT